MAKKASDIRSDDVVVDVDVVAALLHEYHRINEQANTADRRAGQLKARIRELLQAAGASVGRIKGVPVVYHRPVKGYVESALKDSHPDLFEAFTVTRTVEVTEVDWGSLAKKWPTIADTCRKRSLTLDRAGLDQVLVPESREITPGMTS